MLWIEKYRPKTVEEVIGNEKAKRSFINWVYNWKNGKTKELGILLVGPPGTGKTSWVHAFAKSFGYILIETNASDYRSQSALEERLGHITKVITLDSYFGNGMKEPLIFLDEVDGLDPKQDRGGIQAVIKIARESGVLTVLAANMMDSKVHKELLNNFHVIEFRPLTPRQIELLLKRIVREENIDISQEKMEEIAVKAGGDARAAVNMLQSIAIGMDIDAMGVTIENLPFDTFIKRLFEATEYDEIVTLIQSNIGHIEELIRILWDITIRSAIEIKFLADYLKTLSNIDILWRKINVGRMWNLLRYLFILLPNYIYKLKKYVSYEERLPEFRFYLFVKNRKVREQLDEAVKLLADRLHISKRKFITEVLPYIYPILINENWPDLRDWCVRMYGA